MQNCFVLSIKAHLIELVRFTLLLNFVYLCNFFIHFILEQLFCIYIFNVILQQRGTLHGIHYLFTAQYSWAQLCCFSRPEIIFEISLTVNLWAHFAAGTLSPVKIVLSLSRRAVGCLVGCFTDIFFLLNPVYNFMCRCTTTGNLDSSSPDR